MAASLTREEREALREQTLDEIRGAFPPMLTTEHVAQLMHTTVWDVRDKVRRGELAAVKWGNQWRFFREEVLGSLKFVLEGEGEGLD